MNMRLSDIKIKNKFLKTTPSEEKMNNCRIAYDSGDDIGKEIIVNERGLLLDGYIRYLVLKEKGVGNVDVVVHYNAPSYKNNKTMYVYGSHVNNPKEYVWRICNKTQDKKKLAVGNRVLVECKGKLQSVQVSKIVELEQPPVDFRIKKVIRCYGA